jgi:hypothetical protein
MQALGRVRGVVGRIRRGRLSQRGFGFAGRSRLRAPE